MTADRRRWSQAFDDWLAERRQVLRPTAFKKLQFTWTKFLAHCGKRPGEVARLDVYRYVQWLESRARKPSTIHEHLRLLRSFYRFCALRGLHLPADPFERVIAPRLKPDAHTTRLDAHQANALLAAVDRRATLIGRRDYAILLLVLYAGLEIGEIRSLRWNPDASAACSRPAAAGSVECTLSRLAFDPCDQVHIWIVRSKRGPHRKAELLLEAELPPQVAQAVWEWLSAAGWQSPAPGEAQYIFPPVADPHHAQAGQGGAWLWDRPLSTTQTHQLLKRYAGHAGLDASQVTWHTLRHTAARLRIEAGDSAGAIQEFLGMTSLVETRRTIRRIRKLAQLPPVSPSSAGDGAQPLLSPAPLKRRPAGYLKGNLDNFKHGFYSEGFASQAAPAQRLESLRGRLENLRAKAAQAPTEAERQEWIEWMAVVARKIARLAAAPEPKPRLPDAPPD